MYAKFENSEMKQDIPTITIQTNRVVFFPNAYRFFRIYFNYLNLP